MGEILLESVRGRRRRRRRKIAGNARGEGYAQRSTITKVLLIYERKGRTSELSGPRALKGTVGSTSTLQQSSTVQLDKKKKQKPDSPRVSKEGS